MGKLGYAPTGRAGGTVSGPSTWKVTKEHASWIVNSCNCISIDLAGFRGIDHS